MKSTKYAIAIVSIAALSILIWIIIKVKKVSPDSQLEKPDSTPLPPAPLPPAPAPDQSQTSNFIDQGEGLRAVNERMKAIYNSADFQEIFNVYTEKLFDGTKYRSGLKNAMKSSFGSIQKIPIIPTFISTNQKKLFEDINDVNGFENITKQSGFNKALATWRQNMELNGVDFWPPDIAELIEQNQFGNVTKADKDKSERYDAFTADFKAFAKNAASISEKLTTDIRNRAISDLIAAGWKFTGY